MAPSVVRELGRLAPRRIVVVGDKASVPEALAAQAATAANLNASVIERLDGADRYEVSLAVARAMITSDTTSVVVVSGTALADSLSIAASAAQRGEPILLAPSDGLSAGELELIRGGTGHAVTVVGGETVVPTSAMKGVTFTRLAGGDRYDTNWKVFTARYAPGSRVHPILVSGEVFADAVVSSPFAAMSGRPLVLSGTQRYHQICGRGCTRTVTPCLMSTSSVVLRRYPLTSRQCSTRWRCTRTRRLGTIRTDASFDALTAREGKRTYEVDPGQAPGSSPWGRAGLCHCGWRSTGGSARCTRCDGAHVHNHRCWLGPWNRAVTIRRQGLGRAGQVWIVDRVALLSWYSRLEPCPPCLST